MRYFDWLTNYGGVATYRKIPAAYINQASQVTFCTSNVFEIILVRHCNSQDSADKKELANVSLFRRRPSSSPSRVFQKDVRKMSENSHFPERICGGIFWSNVTVIYFNSLNDTTSSFYN